MLEKPITTLFGLALLMFIGWAMVSDTPTMRMERACRPVNWMGNLTVSMAALTEPSTRQASQEIQGQPGKPIPQPTDKPAKPLSAQVQETFNDFSYGCQYALWRLFYEKEYIEEQVRLAQEAQQREAEARRRGKKNELPEQPAPTQAASKTPAPAPKLN